MRKFFTATILILGFVSLSFSGSISVFENGQNKRSRFDSLDIQLQLKNVEKSYSLTHMRYDQTVDGIKVWGGQILKHYDADNNLRLINGRVHTDIEVGTVPFLTKKNAENRVKEILDDFTYTVSTSKLVILPGEDNLYYLTYMVRADKDDSQMLYFIDAEHGGVVLSYDNLKSRGGPSVDPDPDLVAAVGSGTGVLGQAVSNLNTGYSGSAYYASNLVTGGGIDTYVVTTRRLPGSLASDSDNVWTDGSVVDAHKYIENVYDFYYEVFGRRSFDNNDAKIIASVHYGTNYVNAYWNGTQMVFGDGDGVISDSLAGALDIIAHELSHAVTSYTSNLIYLNESGALNEAFSDIMATCAEFYAQPAGNGLLYADWWMGEDVWYPNEEFGDALRYMDDPSQATNSLTGTDPLHYDQIYTGTTDNGGVHYNCTVVGHWFYLLSEGGTNSYSGLSVTGIGIEDAQQIVYEGFTNYMAEGATFSDARVDTLSATTAIFGAGSAQYNAVVEAWNAVGVF